MDEKCETCGKTHHVQWCPLWSLHLCHECKVKRVDTEIYKIVKSKFGADGEVVICGTC